MRAQKYIVGVDEVGRGPLAGPVSVAAFGIAQSAHDTFFAGGLKNSKALSPLARSKLSKKFHRARKNGEVQFAVSSVSQRTIDEKGIVFAIHLAIARALKKLSMYPDQSLVLLDGGIRAPREFIFQQTIIKGDEKHPTIAAASIVAKVHRDSLMIRLAKKYPEYGFERHKGYGTRKHYAQLSKHGPCEIHRKTYLPK